jgi:CheY-like chemotaxis protein
MLLDIGMPKMNGYETARRLREQPWGADILLAALTGWGQEDDKRRTREAGFDHHFVKPLDPAVLQRFLAECEPRS